MVKGVSSSSVTFHINGELHTVDGSTVGANTALVDYIRDVANLKGTKVMCREGGCGACTVSAKIVEPATGLETIKSVNSCLMPVLSCDGWDISTVERLGNKHDKYDLVQQRLVNFHGTQCGYCTPGMVMNMHSLLGSNKQLGMDDVEKNIDGNLCRCTGYRPILEAFKSMTRDASDELKKKCADIEDCAPCPLKNLSAGSCQSSCKSQATSKAELNIKLSSSGGEWITATSLESALTAADKCVRNSVAYRFIAGNTSTGIFKNEGSCQAFIDITGVPELHKQVVGDNEIIIGGGVSLTEIIKLLQEAGNLPKFAYGKRVAKHIERVANVSVRNNGTIAGNLGIKHAHQDFPSDIFVLLEGLGATLTIASSKGSTRVSMIEFLKADMRGKLIISVNLPQREGYHFRSFKITRRYQNAHAYVNAALLFKVDKSGGFRVEEQPRLCYGGISASFVHASLAEAALQGKSLTDGNALQEALASLEKEVKPEIEPLEGSPDYRVHLTKTLLYKTILEIIGNNNVGGVTVSGWADLERKLMTSKQIYESVETDTSLYKNVPKYEAGIQASGEAEYTADIPMLKDELFGAFVVSTVGCADLKGMDASEALKMPGVVRFITAKDIPGINDTMQFNFSPALKPEPIFAEDKIEFNGQGLGVILATSQDIARRAAKLVKVSYDNVTKPVLHIDDAIEKAKADGKFEKQTSGKYTTDSDDNVKVAHSLEGVVRCGAQYHFYMENIAAVCRPREDGIDVFASTQWMGHVQNSIALTLGIPANSVNVVVRRLGGGFGGKLTRTSVVACAAAVGSWVTHRPVRIVMDLESSMGMFGKRLPYNMPYKVGFDENGRIGSLKVDLICDPGYTPNDETTETAALHMQSCYKALGWEVGTHWVTTNTPSNTYCRAPGSVQSVALMEWIMDHIATHLKKDPLTVREANLLETGDQLVYEGHAYQRVNMIPEMIERMHSSGEYSARKKEIEKFNEENRWKKRGLGLVPVRYGMDSLARNLPASIAIYHMDGSVAVTHGGIEMGQGLNTKVIQTVAQCLQVPMERVKVKPSNNFIGANGNASSGSMASELTCYSIMKACEEIRENLRPVLEKLENPSWEKLIEEAYNAKVKLTASYVPTPKDGLKGYDVFILNLVEVEIDVLTGEYKICRTDLYEDTGKSLSPGVDLGQIEGGYIMGQGYWTTEKIVYDENTGKLLTDGTWNYKLPEPRDIPEDFRITVLNNTPNQTGVLRSKATGEPSVDAAFAVVTALRNAISSARADAGNSEWFEMPGPVTPEDVARLCLTQQSHLTI